MSAMPPNHDRILQSFRRSLNNYHQNAMVQAQVAARLMGHFMAAGTPRHFAHIMEFGCSTGLLTRELLAHLHFENFFANDLVSESEALIAPLFDKASSRWRFAAGPIEEIEIPRNLDLIASASTLQWIADTPLLLRKFNDALRAGGWLMFSTFSKSHFPELQQIGSNAGAGGYLDADEWLKILPHGLTTKFLHQELCKIHFPSARAMLSHLRSTGVNANAGMRWTRQKLATFEADYEARFRDADGVCLTYAPLYLIAQKAG